MLQMDQVYTKSILLLKRITIINRIITRLTNRIDSFRDVFALFTSSHFTGRMPLKENTMIPAKITEVMLPTSKSMEPYASCHIAEPIDIPSTTLGGIRATATITPTNDPGNRFSIDSAPAIPVANAKTISTIFT